jgi:hypothetical protein
LGASLFTLAERVAYAPARAPMPEDPLDIAPEMGDS